MTRKTRKEIERSIADLEADDDERAEWSDADAWRAFLTGENPRTGEPLSDEREAERQRGWREYAARVRSDHDDVPGEGK